MRRTARHANNTRTVSGSDRNAGADPNHRAKPSKPTGHRSPGAPAAGAEWNPGHALAPGLHLVATPIGNLGDISLRALWVLRSVDRILCEDTRITARLLTRYGIERPLEPYHDHNADRVRPGILDALRRGDRLALVSDAGTPLVSDPGYKLVREALAEALPVTAVPGASALLAALTLSGLAPDAFLFAGFLPPRPAARRRALARWREVHATLVFFEGPSRLVASLADMVDILGAREAAVARELTKRHEEIRGGRLAKLAEHYRSSGAPRGEIVIVVGPPEATASATTGDVDARLRALLADRSLHDAVAMLAGETGIGRRRLYARALALRTTKPAR